MINPIRSGSSVSSLHSRFQIVLGKDRFADIDIRIHVKGGSHTSQIYAILLLGKDRFADVDIRIRVKGGGHTSQIYAIRQALSKSLVAYYQKCKWCRETYCHGKFLEIPSV